MSLLVAMFSRQESRRVCRACLTSQPREKLRDTFRGRNESMNLCCCVGCWDFVQHQRQRRQDLRQCHRNITKITHRNPNRHAERETTLLLLLYTHSLDQHKREDRKPPTTAQRERQHCLGGNNILFSLAHIQVRELIFAFVVFSSSGMGKRLMMIVPATSRSFAANICPSSVVHKHMPQMRMERMLRSELWKPSRYIDL